jgi:hypothetical protein
MRRVASSTPGRIGLASLVLAAGVLVFLPSTAHADISYTGHAEAYGFRTTATNDAFPLGFVFEGDAPVATADLSSLGDSQALAAAPYPGTTAASTPGAVGGVVGVPLPNYPVVAQATAGDDPAELSFPGLALRADAGVARANGLATLGSAAQGAESSAVVDATTLSTDGVTARAKSRLEALALLDYLHFERVESSAVTVLDPYGKRTSKSDLRIDGITAPGLSFAAPQTTPAQVPLPNPAPGLPQPPNLQFPPVPIPGGGATYNAPELSFRNGQFVVTFTSAGVEQTSPVPFATVADAFKAIGVTVTYQAAQQTKNGIIAPTLTFVTQFPAPPPNPFGVQSATPVTLELGRAAASVDGAALDATGAPFGGGANTAAGGAVGAGSPGSVDAAGTQSLLPPTVAGGPGTLPGATVPGSPAGVALSAAPAGTGAGSPFTDLYVVFVVVAAAVLVAGPLLTVLGSKFVGSRLRWSS